MGLTKFEGYVHNYLVRDRLIVFKEENEKLYFHFTKSQSTLFKKSLGEKGVYISFEYDSNEMIEVSAYNAYQIVNINKISFKRAEEEIELLNQSLKEKRIYETITSDSYKMFLDFEFTMADYKIKKRFTPELLQIGLVVTNNLDKVEFEYSTYIETKKGVSNRTLRFLDIIEEDLKDSLPIKTFYSDFKRIIDIYEPTVYVWGSSDESVLGTFYKINKLKPIECKFVDLMKSIRQYYHLPSDLSLFKALKIFSSIDASQAHHALTDAAATKEIFVSFKDKIMNDPSFDLLAEVNKLKEEAINKKINQK